MLESQYPTIIWISLGLCPNSPSGPCPVPLSLGIRGGRGYAEMIGPGFILSYLAYRHSPIQARTERKPSWPLHAAADEEDGGPLALEFALPLSNTVGRGPSSFNAVKKSRHFHDTCFSGVSVYIFAHVCVLACDVMWICSIEFRSNEEKARASRPSPVSPPRGAALSTAAWTDPPVPVALEQQFLL